MASSQSGSGGGIDRRRMLKYAGAAAAAGVAGCGGGGGDGDTTTTTTSTTDETTTTLSPQEGGRLNVGFESSLTGLDPHFTSSVVSWVVVYNMCETLITFQDGAPAGRLVQSWDISDDGLEYTFTLKEGVMFHPPTDRELVADDVVYSFNRMAQEGAMGSDLAAMESVTANGDYEVTFTMAEPFAPFFNFLARITWVIVPQEAVENQGGELGDFQRPVGTGPFMMGEYQQGNFLDLEAFDGYRESEYPYLDKVRVRPIPDASSRVSSIRAGDIDMARAVPGNNASTLQDASDVDLIRQRGTGWAQVHINCSKDPWSNPAVRRAVAHVINRSAIVEAGVFGFGTAAWQPFPSESIWNYDLGDAARQRDVDKAQQILEDAGNPLEGVTLQIEANTQYQIMKSTADLLVAELNAAGIDAETKINEWGTQLQRFVQKDYSCQAFSVPFKIDPDRHYYPFLAPDGPQYNQYFEDQPDAQRMYELVQNGRSETEQSARVDIYSELQKLINKNLPWISVARTDDLVGLRTNFHGYQPWLLPYTRWWPMWKES
ncbi:MAG: ABC transporter substrate-binding protein [Halobacteriaceae archaeon]